VVLDFGLAMRGRARDRAATEEGGEGRTGASGTLQYLAPELFEGRSADRRSDLYSLGVVLYEAAHGRPPYAFDGRNVMAFISAVREGRRARPALPEGYPQALAGWLEELLSPDPTARPGDAVEVLARLNAACATKLQADLPATRAARLGSGKPVGRDEELAALWRHLDPIESPRLVWLCGGPGSGKTRVLRWLAGEAASRGWTVESPPPVLPIGGGAAGSDALDAYLGGLRRRAAEGPTLVLLDEIESAGGRVAPLLERVAREGQAPPLRVVAALRPNEVRQPVIRELLRETGIVPTLRRVDLAPLGSAGIKAMAERATGTRGASESRVEWLLEASEGNPLVAESLLVEGVWEKGGRTRGADATIARSIAGRAELLGEEGRRWLEALAVLGEPSTEERVGSLAGLEPDAAARAASDVAAAGLARETGDRWSVESRAVGAQFLESLAEDRRRELHRRAAELVMQVTGADAPGVDWQLARLWSRAGDPERALEHALRAAAAAESRQDHALAAECYGFALRHLPRRSSRRAELRLKQAGHLYSAASFRAALRAISSVTRLFEAQEDKLRALLIQSRSFLRIGRFERARVAALQAVEHAEALGMTSLGIDAREVAATALAQMGKQAEALPLFEQLLADARDGGDRLQIATAQKNVGACMVSLQHAGARESLEAAIELFTDLGKPEMALKCQIGLAILEMDSRRYGNASEKIRGVLESARRTGDKEAHKWALAQQTRIAHLWGRFDLAASLSREAEDHALHMGDTGLALASRLERVDALLAVGRPVEAADLVRSALTTWPWHQLSPTKARLALITLSEAEIASPVHDENKIRGDLERTLQTCRALGKPGVLAAALLVEMERRSRPQFLESIDSLREEFDLLIRQQGANSDPRIEVRADLALASNLFHGAKLEAASDAARAAAEKADELGTLDLQAVALALHGEILDELGLVEERDRVLSRGKQRFMEAAERIEDPDFRNDFLNRPEFKRLRPSPGSTAEPADRRLLALYDMIRALNSETDPEALLEASLDMALEVVGAERGMILLREPGGDGFRVRVSRNVEKETERDAESFSHSIAAQAGEGRSILAIDAGNDDRFKDLRSVSLFKIRSLMCVPLRSRDAIVGTVYLDSRHRGRVFSKDDLRFAEAFADHAALALENARARARLELENRRLRAVAAERSSFGNIVGRSRVMQRVFDMIEKVAASDLPVLVHGESGTGKELVARAIHFNGRRKDRLILSENCAAIPESLLESELFGHVRGAFTGADRDRAGLFEQADGGTLFLDEVGDMSPAMQARLLRVLEDGEVRRVGGEGSTRVDVRIVAATNRDLQERVEQGLFRQDLLYRMQVLSIELPALRERHGDIPLLVSDTLERMAREKDRAAPPAVDPEVVELLERYAWPGNVRQLENTLQRLSLLAGEGTITRQVIAEDPALRQALLGQAGDDEALYSLERSEREQIRRALESCRGNRDRAARLLGISRATIYRKIREYELS
jgi:Nif-specific regulatory protein